MIVPAQLHFSEVSNKLHYDLEIIIKSLYQFCSFQVKNLATLKTPMIWNIGRMITRKDDIVNLINRLQLNRVREINKPCNFKYDFLTTAADCSSSGNTK